MSIRNHHFEEYWHRMSEDVGGEIPPPKFIVMHYTAGGAAISSRDYMLLSPEDKARRLGRSKPVYGSAHLVIGREGECWQIVPFNRKARHAGELKDLDLCEKHPGEPNGPAIAGGGDFRRGDRRD